jgi:2OG-Fe(II) oxygenase superfamily
MNLINPAVLSQAQALGAEFSAAKPYRHICIDNFFDAEFAQSLLSEFPAFDVKLALNEAGVVGGKSVHEKISAISTNYANLDQLIQTPEFLHLVGTLTGISSLRYDPYYFGGGTHENRHGQDLDPHIDFNRHPVERWHRRLNLIVYLNPEWHDDWGGQLEIHRDPYAPDNQIKSIAPLFNRCVIFETNEISWHGFSRIVLPDPQRETLSRKSIALYFYTDTRPAEELADTHSTVYVDRPLPAHLHAGHTLTQDDIDTLKNMWARRDQHSQRLYRDLMRQEKALEQSNAALTAGRLGRLVHFARKALAKFGK